VKPIVPLVLAAAAVLAAAPSPGQKAPAFALSSLDGRTVRLREALAQAPVVLVVLRGYPGYQCPLCNRQVRDLIAHASDLAAARVILVYPGAPGDLEKRAREFTADKALPPNFDLVLDPGYEFTNLYGLRWNSPKETAYPATFLIDGQGIVFFSKVSDSHGGRTTAREIVQALGRQRSGEK
jgi:peroxiredoxin